MTTTPAAAQEQVRAAHSAFLSSRTESVEARSRWLVAISEDLDVHAEELVDLAVKETHLDEGRLGGELRRTVFQLKLLAQEVRHGEHLGATIDHEDPAWGMGPRPDIRRMNVPLGVVGVFGASNFPFAFSVMGGDTASALAAGCAVVHKIHEGHPLLGRRTAEVVADALSRAGAPPGLFSVVTGRAAAEALVDDPLVKAIGFTGSTTVGRALFDRAAGRPEPIPFFGELGSVNPVFVTRQAWQRRRDTILAGLAASFTVGMGQFCTKPGVVFVPESDDDAVAKALRTEIDGRPPATMLTPRLRQAFAQSVEAMADTDGVHVLVVGDDAEAPRPTVFKTTVETVGQTPEILAQEMFGPATLVVEYERMEQLIEIASGMQGQLTTSVHAEPGEDLDELLLVLAEKSGRIVLNNWPTGVTVTHAQNHGGPYPATTAPGTTSVGTAAIARFMRSVAYQSFDAALLPQALRDENPWGIRRRVDGVCQPLQQA
jgi:acyl-CoA reductase-like NAD-dependent aldehyde dehydrogenase